MKSNKYKEHLDEYIELLQNDINYLQSVALPKFDSIKINCSMIGSDFRLWSDKLVNKGIDKDCPVLYYISFAPPVIPADILEIASNAKAKSKKMALPQINKGRTSNILYVGKTNCNFPSRLRYHLGLVESKTYALHLKHWAKDFSFTLHFAKLCFPAGEIKYLELMESALHNSLQPLLGRSGH